MVKEDFHSSKYDRAFKCDTGRRQRVRGGEEEGNRQGRNGNRERNTAKERRDRKGEIEREGEVMLDLRK